MRITLIHNPRAGDGDYSREELVGMIRDGGHEVRYRSAGGHLRSAVRKPADLIVAAGGDGTIAEVASFLAGRSTPLAVIPSGTANNIAWSLGIGGPLRELIRHWKRRSVKLLYLGSVRGLRSPKTFFESVGAGLFAELLNQKKRSEESKQSREARLRASVRRLLELARGLKPQWWNLTLDGRDASGRYLMIEAMHIRSIGPNLQLAPAASPLDRFLNVVMIRDDQRDELLEYLRSQLESLGLPARFDPKRVRRVRLESHRANLHVDDRPHQRRGAVRLDISVNRKAVRLLI